MAFDVRIIMGSKSNGKITYLATKILTELGVSFTTNAASCHWNIDENYLKYAKQIPEKIVMVIGGMSLAAPAIIAAIVRNAEQMDKIIYGVPLDEAARSALEDLPFGTYVFTNGLNTTDVATNVKNSALAVAQLVGMLGKPQILENLKQWYKKNRKKKGIEKDIKLDENGVIEKEEGKL